jgi:hypothetical protein
MSHSNNLPTAYRLRSLLEPSVLFEDTEADLEPSYYALFAEDECLDTEGWGEEE